MAKTPVTTIVKHLPAGIRVVYPPYIEDGIPSPDEPEVRGEILSVEEHVFSEKSWVDKAGRSLKTPKVLKSKHLAFKILIDKKDRDVMHTRTDGIHWERVTNDEETDVKGVASSGWVAEKSYKAEKVKLPKNGRLEFQSDNAIMFCSRLDPNAGFTLSWEETPKAFAKALRRCAAWLDKHAKDVITVDVD